MLKQILDDLMASVNGARAAIFLDGDGETIAQAGDTNIDGKLLGAWKEIHLDHIKEISARLELGRVRAVLFSLDNGNELVAPVAGEYCVWLLFSVYADLQAALAALKTAVDRLKKDIE